MTACTTTPLGEPIVMPAPVCAGQGANESRARILAKGQPNTHPNAGTAYDTITLIQILDLVKAPVIAAKGQGRWMLASAYAESDARSFDVQSQRGSYQYLLVDIDKGNVDLERVVAVLKLILPDTYALIHSSSSVTPDDNKWHIIIPLAVAIPYRAFVVMQQALFNGYLHNVINVDSTLARAAQLFYLPAIREAGAYYESTSSTGAIMDFSSKGWFYDHAQALFKADLKQVQFVGKGDGMASVIGWVRRNYMTEDLMLQYGWARSGEDWSSPEQQVGSGGFATMIRPDGSWFSLSDSDKASGIGQSGGSGQNGDAFDLITFHAFGNDRQSALDWAYEQRTKMEAIEINRLKDTVSKLLGGSV